MKFFLNMIIPIKFLNKLIKTEIDMNMNFNGHILADFLLFSTGTKAIQTGLGIHSRSEKIKNWDNVVSAIRLRVPPK